MFITTTLTAREIIASALPLHKDAALQCGALCRRLGISEQGAKEAAATNKYLEGVFSQISPQSVGDESTELPTPSAAHVLRHAIIMWVQKTQKRDVDAHQFTLTTDYDEKRPHAQRVIDQMAEQLGLAADDLSVLANTVGKPVKEPKAPKEKKKGPKIEK